MDLEELFHVEQRFTRGEVERMIGVSRRQLDYWTRLRLVFPKARWGERFFSFSDLVALETIKRLSAGRVPARRLRRAMVALERQLGQAAAPLSALRVSANGSQVVVQPPDADGRLIEPLTGQFVMNFETSELAGRVRALASHTAEEWFEIGLACDASPDSLAQAADAYRRAIEISQDWVEAYINLGTTLYQLNRMEESREMFEQAAGLDPQNALAEFNLGCVLERLGEIDGAVSHLLRATELQPSLADAHLNLALAFEKRGKASAATRHLSLYLRYEPQGPWAEFARTRLERYVAAQTSTPSGKITPFRYTK